MSTHGTMFGISSGAPPAPLTLRSPDAPSTITSGIPTGSFTVAGTLMAPGVGTAIGVGLDILNLVGKTYNQWVARKEAKEARAQARKDYSSALAREATRYQEEVGRWKVGFKLKKSEVKHRMKQDKLARQDALRQEGMSIASSKINRTLSMLNDPTQKPTYLSIMKGGR